MSAAIQPCCRSRGYASWRSRVRSSLYPGGHLASGWYSLRPRPRRCGRQHHPTSNTFSQESVPLRRTPVTVRSECLGRLVKGNWLTVALGLLGGLAVLGAKSPAFCSIRRCGRRHHPASNIFSQKEHSDTADTYDRQIKMFGKVGQKEWRTVALGLLDLVVLGA